MRNVKRYVAVVEFYVWAETDDEAIELAKAVCKKQNDEKDNNCELVNLVEQPVGTFGNRQVYSIIN